jgi:hypothetical protein
VTDPLCGTRTSPTPTDAGGGTLWLPVFSEWQERRLPLVSAMLDGMTAAGIEARVDVLGKESFALTMLRARCPGPGIETAEQWLLRRVKPLDVAGADWAGNVVGLLHQRWREFPLVSGSAEELDRVTERITAGSRGSDRWFAGARFGVICSRLRCLFTYARPATEVVRCLPDARVVGGEVDEDPRQWLAVDVAHKPSDVAELVELGSGLTGIGFSTRRWEWSGGKSALLTIHADDGSADELETRIGMALGGSRPSWASKYRPWSWATGVWVHRHAAPEGWRLREWLEREMGLPVVDASERPSEPILIRVPAAHVDRALEVLARRPARF